MAQIQGTNIIAPVVPLDTTDVHPSHEARYGKGGYRTVATLAERNAIPVPRLEAGMLVYVQADGKAYQLGTDLATWNEFKSGASTWTELAGKPEEFPPSAHQHPISDVTGLADDLAAKVPLAGATMAVDASLSFSNATTDSQIGGWGFGVEITQDNAHYATVEPTAITISNANGSTQLTPGGMTLPNATQVIVGSFDNSTGGQNGVSLICAVGYELNWQGGRLRSVQIGGDGTPQTIYVDSPISFQAGATGISYDDLNDLPTLGTAASQDSIAFAAASHGHTIADVSGLQTALDSKQAAGSYATLTDGKVPASQLPSYVDDVIEAASLAALPATGETGKIYVTLDTNKTYRWSGSAYVEISASPGSTDSVAEGSTNLYYTNARASAAAPVQSVNGQTGTVTINVFSGSYNDLTNKPTLFSGSYADLTNVPSTFTPAAHNQAWSTITSTPTTLAGYGITDAVSSSDSRLTDARTPLFHTHSVSDVSGAVGTSDSRLSDQRTPTDGSVTDAKITSGGLSTSSLNWAAITAWAPSTAYAKGDLVSYLGVSYRRSAAGTSGTTFSATNWQQITPSEFVGSQITSGTVPIARLGTGSPSSANFLRGDGTFATAGSTSASDLTSGTLPEARLPNSVILHPFLLAGM